jgi:succinate dehydrogenase / fumarate reductase, flavoprotein subunit
MFDTVKGSDYLGDQDAIEYMCREAIPTVYELEHAGVPFSRLDNGKIYQRAFGGQSQNFGGDQAARTCAAADRTGHAILHTLYQQNLRARTHFFDEFFAIDLVRDEEGHLLRGPGPGDRDRASRCSSRPRPPCSPPAAAARSSAPPPTPSSTPATAGHGPARRGAAAGHGVLPVPPDRGRRQGDADHRGGAGRGRLSDERARRALHGALRPQGAQGPREPGRGEPRHRHRGARGPRLRGGGRPRLLKLDHLGEAVVSKRLPGISEICRTFRGRPGCASRSRSSPPPTTPWAASPPTASAGWWPRRATGPEEVVPGLYAAGECACVSVHGANRLGGNSLLDILVFGRAAGNDIIEFLRRTPTSAAARFGRGAGPGAARPLGPQGRGRDRPTSSRRSLRKLMEDHCGVFRTEEVMAEGVEQAQGPARAYGGVRLRDHSRPSTPPASRPWSSTTWWTWGMATRCRPSPQGEPRRPLRVDFPKRDDANWMKHSLYFRRPTAWTTSRCAPSPSRWRAFRRRRGCTEKWRVAPRNE